MAFILAILAEALQGNFKLHNYNLRGSFTLIFKLFTIIRRPWKFEVL